MRDLTQKNEIELIGEYLSGDSFAKGYMRVHHLILKTGIAFPESTFPKGSEEWIAYTRGALAAAADLSHHLRIVFHAIPQDRLKERKG